jgi:hypothetical protein
MEEHFRDESLLDSSCVECFMTPVEVYIEEKAMLLIRQRHMNSTKA